MPHRLLLSAALRSAASRRSRPVTAMTPEEISQQIAFDKLRDAGIPERGIALLNFIRWLNTRVPVEQLVSPVNRKDN